MKSTTRTALERKTSQALRLFFLVLIWLAVTLVVTQRASAGSFTISQGDMQFETRSASAGNRINWEWTSTSSVVFSVSRSENPSTVLYSKTGISDAASLSISDDDTYLLVWFNFSNHSVTVNYSVSVVAGEGSTLLLLFSVFAFLLFVAIALTALKRRRRSRKAGETQTSDYSLERDSLDSASMPGHAEEISRQVESGQPMPSSRPTTTSDLETARGTRFCQRCGSQASLTAVFCANCGERLSS